MLENVRSLIQRVRWRSVLAVVLLIIVCYLIYTSLPGGYSVGGGIGIWASIDPTSIAPGEPVVVSVELKNMRSDKGLMVYIRGLTYNENLFFDETYAQSYTSQKISIGPQEIRRLSLKMRSKDVILDGKYALDSSAYEEGKEAGASQRIFLDVSTKK
jgi:hypothetical protein